VAASARVATTETGMMAQASWSKLRRSMAFSFARRQA
jgi:hypothetical protein